MPKVTVPAMRDNTTIARVAALDSGGTMTKMEDGAVVITAPRRLFLSRRGIESALGYPMRHSVWRNLKDQAEDGVVTIADDMTLLIEREASATGTKSSEETTTTAGYTTQRYRTRSREAPPVG
jgi:hypothetical protein